MSKEDYLYGKPEYPNPGNTLNNQLMLGAGAILTPIMGYKTLKSGTQGLFGTNTLAERYQYLQQVWEGDDSGIYGRCTNLAQSIFGSTDFSDRAHHLLTAGIYGIITAATGYTTYYAYNQINDNIRNPMEYKNPELKRQFDRDYETCKAYVLNKEVLANNFESLKKQVDKANREYIHIKNNCSSELDCPALSTPTDELIKAKNAWETAGNDFKAAQRSCRNGFNKMGDAFEQTGQNADMNGYLYCNNNPTDSNCQKRQFALDQAQQFHNSTINSCYSVSNRYEYPNSLMALP